MTQILWRYQELLDDGLSRQRIQRLLARGELKRLRKNCYVQADHWAALEPIERLELQARAHHHSLVGRHIVGHVYSHETAAVLHALKLWRPEPGVHLTQPTRTSNASHGADVVNHSAHLDDDDVVLLHGLPVTSLTRTMLDCARHLPSERALIIADQCLQRGASRSAALTALDCLGPVVGVTRARRVLAEADARSESPGETLTRVRLHRFGVPPAEPQVEVRTRAGVYRLDFAWPELLVGLEFDGRSKYFGDVPTEEVLFQERRRERILTEEGWTIIRIEWADLFREAELEARLRSVLEVAQRRTDRFAS
jgi:very-short-patch-repair endonuclease